MGSGKDSGSAKTYDYFGTVAGLVCYGPVDGIHALWVDGKEVFTAPPGGTAASVEPFMKLTPVDSKWHDEKGYIRIYWGTPDQPANPDLGPLHPPYRGFCYVVLHRFLFGRERSASPNIEVIVWRKPRPPAFLEPVDMEDGQVNPVPVMAEWLTGLIGLEQPVALLDEPSWLSAAAWVWGLDENGVLVDPIRRSRMAVSPLLVDTGDVRSRLSALLELTELCMAWNESGQLALRRLDLGEDPTGLPLLDARYITSRTILSAGGWRDVPTGYFVRFIDRARRWKEAGQKIDNILARQIRGEPNREELDFPWVTREPQAAAIAARLLVRSGRPACTLAVQVRSTAAEGLLVGSKVLVDIDPEPGGVGLAQAAIVTERREPREGPVALTLVADTLAEATPYLPAWTPGSIVPGAILPILEALVIPLHPDAWSLTAAIAVLAARPQPDAIGVRLAFAPAAAPDSFTRLGDQPGYAAQVTLKRTDEELPPGIAAAAIDEILTLRLDAGADGPDAYLAARIPADPGAASQDELLVVLAQLDGAGRVALDPADGQPLIEICSVVDRDPVVVDPPDPGLFAYTVLRGRKGTSPLEWPVDARGWILPLINLVPWTHPRLSSLARGTEEGRIRLVSFNRYAADESDPIPERGFYLPVPYDVMPRVTWTLPAVDPAPTDLTGKLQVDLVVSDPGGDLVYVALTSRHGTDPTVERRIEDFPQTQSWPFAALLNFTGEGVHTLQALARDAAGHQAVSIRQVIVPPSGGGGNAPTFSPPGQEFWDVIYVTITAAPGHTNISWKVTDPQPNQPPVFNGHAGTHVVVKISGTKYLWAASGIGGTTTSPVVFASYKFLGIFGA